MPISPTLSQSSKPLSQPDDLFITHSMPNVPLIERQTYNIEQNNKAFSKSDLNFTSDFKIVDKEVYLLPTPNHTSTLTSRQTI